jgi:YD repeat-containing protein
MKRLVFYIAVAMFACGPLGTLHAANLDQPYLTSNPSVSYAAMDHATGEVVGLRTRTSRTYIHDGHYEAQISAGSVNYQDTSGHWQPIDDSLVPATDPHFMYQNKANRYAVSFPSDLGSGPVRVQTSSGWIQFSLVGGSSGGSVSGDTDTFALPGGSVAWAAGADTLKESITLQSAASPATYVFDLQTSPGVSAEQSSSGGIGFVNAGGRTVFSFTPPSMQDAAGATSDAASMSLASTPSGNTVTVSADPAWLASPDRQYPVVIDPSTSLTDTTQACELEGGAWATATRCNGSTISVGDSGAPMRGLFYFDVSSIPWTSVIYDAQLGLTTAGHGACTTSGTADFGVYGMTRNWTSKANWNTYDGTNTWTSPGGDFDSSMDYSDTTVSPTVGWYYWYPVNLVQSWVDGSLPNDGLMIKEPTEVTGQCEEFDSGPYSQTNAPKLTVQYGPLIGSQDYYTTVDHQINDVSSLSVNVANGNLELDASDLTMDGIDLPIDVTRTYNSLAVSSRDLGPNWVFDSAGDVGLTFYSDGTIDYGGPTGLQEAFSRNPDGTYNSPPGIDATLSYLSGSYYLTDNDTGISSLFNSTGHLTSERDTTGNSLTFLYNASGQCTTITDTQGHQTTFTYASGKITQMTDAAGRTYGYAYDASGRLATYTDPAQEATQYGYDSSNRLTQVTDPLGHITKIAYDSSSRVASLTYVTDPTSSAGYTTSFTYGSASTTVTDPNNHATKYVYNGRGLVTSTTDPEGNTTSTIWSSDNQVTTTTAPSGATVTQTYNSNNVPTQVTLPTKATIKVQYGNASLPYNPTGLTSPQGKTTTVAYNNSTRTVASVTDPLSNKGAATYNSNGTTATSTDPSSNQTSYSYTDGLLTGIAPPSPLGAIAITYNSYNLPATETDGEGNETAYTYDIMGRVTGIAYADGSGVGYSYDADGNVLTTINTAVGGAITADVSYQYDALNDVTQKAIIGGETLTYTYDGVGNILTQTDSGGTVVYTYTPDDQTATVTDRQGNLTTLSYDKDGNETSVAYASGVTQQTAYDAAGDITKVWATDPSNAILTSFTYNYVNPSTAQQDIVPYSVTDASGNVTSYQYDANYQLTSAVTKDSSGTQTASYAYAYTPDGQVSSTTTNGTTVQNSYNDASELLQSGSTTYSYTKQGFLTSGSDGSSYTYNAAQQTTGIFPPSNSGGVNLTYYGAGQTDLQSAGSTTYTQGVMGTASTENAGQKTYITTTSDGQILSFGSSQDIENYLTDGSGSVVGLADATGKAAALYGYSPTCATTFAFGSTKQNNPYYCNGMTQVPGTSDYNTGGGYVDASTGAGTDGGQGLSPHTNAGVCLPRYQGNHVGGVWPLTFHYLKIFLPNCFFGTLAALAGANSLRQFIRGGMKRFHPEANKEVEDFLERAGEEVATAAEGLLGRAAAAFSFYISAALLGSFLVLLILDVICNYHGVDLDVVYKPTFPPLPAASIPKPICWF